MKYWVLDNGKPANYYNHKADSSWNKTDFDSLFDAIVYAIKWLDYADLDAMKPIEELVKIPGLPKTLADGNIYDYSGYGDTIQIIKLEDNYFIGS